METPPGSLNGSLSRHTYNNLRPSHEVPESPSFEFNEASDTGPDEQTYGECSEDLSNFEIEQVKKLPNGNIVCSSNSHDESLGGLTELEASVLRELQSEDVLRGKTIFRRPHTIVICYL